MFLFALECHLVFIVGILIYETLVVLNCKDLAIDRLEGVVVVRVHNLGLLCRLRSRDEISQTLLPRNAARQILGQAKSRAIWWQSSRGGSLTDD